MKQSVTDLLSQLHGKTKVRVLFVCLGNICRSPAAQGIFEAIAAGDDRFETDSAGLYHGHCGDLPDRRMRVHARQRGYELTHRARPLTASDFDDFDIIIGMDRGNLDGMRQLVPSVEAWRKVIPMIELVGNRRGYDHIPDPYYEGSEGFELVLDLLEDGCNNLYDSMTCRL